jgi:ATP/ADP translocase
MCCGVLKAAGGLGAIVALILVVIALLKQLILLVGWLLAAIKIGIIVVFVALLVMILLAIFRDRCRKRRESQF